MAWLRTDVETSEHYVNNLVKVPLTQSQFDALVSLVFNIGGGAFRKSTLLLRLNDGEDLQAADEFLKWNRAGGKVMAGLVKRRESEREQFLA